MNAALCPECSKKGQAVKLSLVRHQLTNTWERGVEGKEFSFCETPSCPVVYFTVDGTRFTVTDIRHAPAYKTNDPSDFLCFCFDVAADDLGNAKSVRYIRERVKVGECACDVLNPSGDCCLGSIGRWQKASKK